MPSAPATMADSKVEVKGWQARYYDLMMDLGSLGRYGALLRDVITKMEIRPRDQILDLGCGTGRNCRLMAERLSGEGRIVGVEIGEEMIRRFEKNCAGMDRVTLRRAWKATSFYRKGYLMATLLASLFDDTELDEEKLTELRKKDVLSEMMNEIGEAVKLNPKYEEANHSLELMKNSKKGFLILLRAILK